MVGETLEYHYNGNFNPANWFMKQCENRILSLWKSFGLSNAKIYEKLIKRF